MSTRAFSWILDEADQASLLLVWPSLSEQSRQVQFCPNHQHSLHMQKHPLPLLARWEPLGCIELCKSWLRSCMEQMLDSHEAYTRRGITDKSFSWSPSCKDISPYGKFHAGIVSLGIPKLIAVNFWACEDVKFWCLGEVHCTSRALMLSEVYDQIGGHCCCCCCLVCVALLFCFVLCLWACLLFMHSSCMQ